MRHWSRRPRRRHAARLLVGLLGLITSGIALAEPDPEFHPAPCALPNIPAEAMSRLTCGTVAVPRRYDHPEQGSLTLAIAILHRPDEERLHDPILYIQGGPGFPLLDHADYLLHQILGPRRDLVLVDQRGTGRSEPSFCAGGTHDLLAVLARGGPADRLAAGFRAAYAACRAELLQAGAADLFGTRASAEDMERVRRALGLGQWNLYGVSYGTTVAMTLATIYPRPIRAMVLDSVYPPEPLPQNRAQSFAASLASLFRLCAADPACNAAYPALDRLYADTLRRLDSAPLPIAMPPALGLPDDRVLLSASEFEIVSFFALYERSSWTYLPHLIKAAHDGSAGELTPLLTGLMQWYGERTLGAALAVQCRDRPDSGGTAGLLDLLTAGGETCAGWPVTGPAPSIPIGRPIPTLILSGALDPVTPSSFGRLTAHTIGATATWLELPNVAHGVQHSALCGAILVWRFVRSPYQHPDESCIAAIPPISFADTALAAPAPAP